MEREREERLLDRIATLLVHLYPGGWEKADLAYCAVGRSYELVAINGGLVHPRRLNRHRPSTATAFHAAEELLPESGVFDLLRRLRSEMYEEGRGTWVEFCLEVFCAIGGKPKWTVRYEWPDEIVWWADVPAAAVEEELRLFPRDEEHVPDWMRRAVDARAAARTAAEAVASGAVQDEHELVAGRELLFVRARDLIRDLAPRAVDRLLVGRVADGCWSVLRASEGMWAAVGPDGASSSGDGPDTGGAVPFDDVRDAVAYAVGGVLAEAGAQVDSEVLRLAGLLYRQRERDPDREAWMLAPDGRQVSGRSRGLIRPESGSYINLEQVHNRPVGWGYFVCEAGPAPARGGFVSVHEVFRRLAGQTLPKPPPEPDPDPMLNPPVVELEVGTELDAYGSIDEPFLYEIGTPFSVRGLYGSPEAHPYRVFRVQKPLRASPGLFVPAPVFAIGDEEEPEPPEGRGRGYYLVESIADLIASGHLVEITGPGGTPVRRIGQ